MAPTTASTEPTRPLSTRRLLRYGLLALIAACALNLVVLLLGTALIEFPSEFVGGPFGPLAVGPVLVNSAIAAAGATLVYAVVARYSARPNRPFVAIAGVALVLSFAMFLAPDVAGAPLDVFAVLAVMHVAAAVAVVGVLTRSTIPGAASR